MISQHIPNLIVRTYRVLDCRESITGIGVVWPVERLENHGRCGCGEIEMKDRRLVAFFADRNDADKYVSGKMELVRHESQ